jgi:hypothetical protein
MKQDFIDYIVFELEKSADGRRPHQSSPYRPGFSTYRNWKIENQTALC